MRNSNMNRRLGELERRAAQQPAAPAVDSAWWTPAMAEAVAQVLRDVGGEELLQTVLDAQQGGQDAQQR